MITVPCGTLEICRDCDGDPRVPQMKRSHGFEKLPQKVGVSMEWNRVWGFWRLGLGDWEVRRWQVLGLLGGFGKI